MDISPGLIQFGPTNDVLVVDELCDDTLVFPGTVRVAGNIDVAAWGADLKVTGQAGIRGSLEVAGRARCLEGLDVGWGIRAGHDLQQP